MGFDDAESNDDASNAVTSLIELARVADHDGPAWSRTTTDLNVNLVVLRGGKSVGDHVNSEVDVLLVGVDGHGQITIDDSTVELKVGGLVIVPKSARRSIAPIGERFSYLTCHKRRAGLWPGTRE